MHTSPILHTHPTEELSRSVPPHQTRQPSTSPQTALRGLSISDDDPRHLSRPSSAMGGATLLSSSRSYSAYPDSTGYAAPASMHPRGASDPARTSSGSSGYHASTTQPPMQPYQQSYSQQAGMRAMDPRALASGTYPYAPPQPQIGQIPVSSASSSSRVDSGASRYECSYCSKGFTRPSSLRVRFSSSDHRAIAY